LLSRKGHLCCYGRRTALGKTLPKVFHLPLQLCILCTGCGVVLGHGGELLLQVGVVVLERRQRGGGSQVLALTLQRLKLLKSRDKSIFLRHRRFGDLELVGDLL